MAQRETVQRSRRKPLVLYVEDNDEIAEMYGLAAFNDYTVIRLRRGLEVVRWLEDHRGSELPNMIVLDHNLPDISGVETLHLIRQDERFAHVYVVMLSNEGDPDVHEAAFRLGALRWLMKSTMTPQQVARRLREDLQTRGKVG